MPEMNSSSPVYVFGGNQTELQRLVVQAAGLESEARWMLDRIGVRSGWRALDVGCGPIGILNLLSERVGPHGAVIGLEREARFAQMALTEIDRRRLGNVSIVEADALGAALDVNSFNFVHERLVLMNMPEINQKALVSRMLALLKPGGVLALQDYDRVSCLCYPEHPSWTILLGAYGDAFQTNGGNGATGRSLPWLLRCAGAENIQTKVHARSVDVGDIRRTHHVSLLEVMQEKILALGWISERDFAEHKAALLQHLHNPDTLLIDHLLVQTWGTKPV
jgi:SAM-dependent methyltransferase